MLNDGKVKTLPTELHIQDLAKKFISINKMSDAGVHTIFEKDRWRMILGTMVLMRGVWCGNMYKLLGINVIDECNNRIVPKSKNEERKVTIVSRVDTMLSHKILGHIGDKGIQSLQCKGLVEGLYN